MSSHPKPDDAAPKQSSSMLPKIFISGFIASVVIVETVLFFFFVPSADDVAALAEAHLIKKVESKMEHAGETTMEDENKAVEFTLGEHRTSFIPAGADGKYCVEFRLFGTVKKSAQPRLEKLYKEHDGRFRDSLMLEIRNATMDELNENQLGLLRRRILATSNELLGEPILYGIGFKDFQVFEE